MGFVAQAESESSSVDCNDVEETVLRQQQQQVKQARRTSHLQTLDNDPTAIAFDVYQPDNSFRKTDPGRPHFVVAVASFKATTISILCGTTRVTRVL